MVIPQNNSLNCFNIILCFSKNVNGGQHINGLCCETSIVGFTTQKVHHEYMILVGL